MSEDTGECVSCDKLSEQVEKLTKERDDLHRAFNQPVPRSEWEKMQEQLAALAEQNAKMRKVLLRLACLGNGDQYGNSIGNCIAQEALSLPNLATPPVSEDRKDAERYLWLRASDFDIFGSPHAIHLSGKELDQAIDAAMYGEVK